MIVFALLFSISAFAAGSPEKWPEAWRAQLDGAPAAVAFDIAGESLLVSLQEGGEARLDRYSLKGEPVAKGILRTKGEAGAVARYDQSIFWLVDGAVKKATLPKGKLEAVASVPGNGFRSLTVNREGAPVADDASAVFLLVEELFVARGKNTLATAKTTERICQRSCRGLARSSEGEWLTVEGRSVVAAKGGKFRTLFTAPFEGDGIAYVFRKDQTQDLVLLWSHAQKLLVAFSPPAKGNP